MTKSEIYKVIQKEILWCQNTDNRTMPEDWHNGFIGGLKQAIRLIRLMRTFKENHLSKRAK